MQESGLHRVKLVARGKAFNRDDVLAFAGGHKCQAAAPADVTDEATVRVVSLPCVSSCATPAQIGVAFFPLLGQTPPVPEFPSPTEKGAYRG